MTAYGAVLSLENTINNILRCSRFSLVDRSRKIIDFVYQELHPLQRILERLDSTSPSRSRKKVNALDGIIKDAIWKFEDSLESLLILQIPSHCEILPEIVSIDLQSLDNDVHSLIEKLEVMEEYTYEVENMAEDEPISSIIGFHGTNSKIIGLSDQFRILKIQLLKCQFSNVYVLYGMAGIGKTALAIQIYEDAKIQSKYECRAWVTVGRVPQPTSQIKRGVLAQLCGIAQGDEEISDYCLEESLQGKKCLIVLDDVWDTELITFLVRHFYERLGDISIMITGRHRASMCFRTYHLPHHIVSYNEVRFLTEEESMELLCEKVFGDEICPPQLHKAATKIAKLCEGLPLLILTVADILSKSEQNRDPTYWNEVAERRNSVFTDAYNRISKVLFPSYEYLPQRHKMPFLFMGVFPQDYHTPPSKIIDMLTAEGLLPNLSKWLSMLATFYSLVLYTVKSVNKTSHNVFTYDYKTCRLHSTWRHVCRGEASKKKFYHVLNKLADASEESLKGQRGLCLENNMLFGIKEFCNLVRLNSASSARFLLFYGPYHQYPIPIDVGFTLLREIDALTQRFYTFPIEILSLVQLKYLALKCNGELPATISKLFNLQVLIIRPHMNIRRRGAPSYVPIQIWEMQELKHIEILGKSLAVPSNIAQLEKLATLVGVNASICTITELFKRIPNIQKLGIQIEQTPYGDHNDLLSCFRCISTLQSLKTLKFSITNPVVKHGRVFPVTPGSLKLPPDLRKLHLSGMGFPLEYMDVIGSLPFLEVLKLRSYAFQGSRWDAQWDSFRSLKFLLIEDSDLVQLKLSGSSNNLNYLSMKHCYKLKEIHNPASLYLYVCDVEIELEDCNPLALTCVSQLRLGDLNTLDVIASSSFYEKPTTIRIRREVEDLNEDYDFEGKGDDEYTNTSEEESDGEYTV
ncbi:putative late blight resistance protein homolog R1B-12 isoform X2 [Salvia hispanica]|uniref:putative late blight resistance protein homolog R1B-12 isoform X2 n=1 Tax=Salvia hispanica TaxID=49212 RepID=UPI0020092959|nr:putative late blight resistance protein homolog R1B-12 isoform X2 [Salvia hispanica]